MIFSPWLLAWLLVTWRVNTLAPPAPLLRSTLLLPRADPPRLLEIDFSLPRVSDSIDSAAAAAACVVRAEVGSELAPAPRLLAASGHWSLLRPGSGGGSAPAPAHLHFHFYYSLLQRYLKNVLLQARPHPRCQPIRVIKHHLPRPCPPARAGAGSGNCRVCRGQLRCRGRGGVTGRKFPLEPSDSCRAGRGVETPEKGREGESLSVLCSPSTWAALRTWRGARPGPQEAASSTWAMGSATLGIIK